MMNEKNETPLYKKKEKEGKTQNNTYLKQKEQNKINTKIKKIERDITDLENQITNLNTQLTKPEIYTNYEQLTTIQTQLQDLTKKLEANMSDWEQLNESLTSFQT